CLTQTTATPVSFYPSRHHPAVHSFPTRRSSDLERLGCHRQEALRAPNSRSSAASAGTDRAQSGDRALRPDHPLRARWRDVGEQRSEEHTSELQSQSNLVCRLLLEKK